MADRFKPGEFDLSAVARTGVVPQAAFDPKAATAAGFVTSGPVFVDISAEPVRTNIVRQGFQVPAAEINRDVLDSFINQWTPITPRQAPRVVVQSIAPGTNVPAGTAVHLTLAPKSIIPLDIFSDVHSDMRGRTVETINTSILENASVRRAVLENRSAAELTDAQRQEIVTALTEAEIDVDDAQPEKSFERAFASLRNAAAFR